MLSERADKTLPYRPRRKVKCYAARDPLKIDLAARFMQVYHRPGQGVQGPAQMARFDGLASPLSNAAPPGTQARDSFVIEIALKNPRVVVR